MNKFIPTLLERYHKWGFSLNETKSKAVFFSKRKKHPSKLVVSNHHIPWSTSAKYLGVIFDRKLKWTQQVTAVRNKANGAYQQLKPFFNNRSVSSKTKIRAFNAIIRSVCTYAIPIWGATSENNLKRLEGTYMRIMRGSLKYPWYIRNKQILAETGLPSLKTAAVTYAKNLRTAITNHPNPTIQSLSTHAPKPTDKYLRPCSLLQNL